MGWMETVTQAVTQEVGAVSRCCCSSSSSHDNEECKIILERAACIGNFKINTSLLLKKERTSSSRLLSNLEQKPELDVLQQLPQSEEVITVKDLVENV